MGIVKEAKANTASAHAARARREGRTMFLYRQNVPATSSGWSGPVAGVAEVVEAIEQAGWRLTDITFDRAQSNNGAVLLLFRLPPPSSQPQPQQMPQPQPQPQQMPQPQRMPPYSQQQGQPWYRAGAPNSFQP